MTEIRAICFDAFGTLVDIADKRRPFQRLLSGKDQGNRAAELLTTALDMRGLTRNLAHDIDGDHLSQLEKDLQAECASVRLRPGIDDIWDALRRMRLRIGVCSNLALPYGPPLLSALPDVPDAVVLSYEVGFIKPDPAIFRLVCGRL
jgi:FMN phosphatase YigB (HAD superfamily)